MIRPRQRRGLQTPAAEDGTAATRSRIMLPFEAIPGCPEPTTPNDDSSNMMSPKEPEGCSGAHSLLLVL
jgi:hypothetical protein